ncbi:hypothetical protein HMPREF7215_1327 [Pyramidobacter piscolens W5455]|uniref:Uncharacterized protein n=1 Tax=Pyramidobacter piscolens W5455 TaxID=352165 RepID=A0ABM9ZSC9_9BACT|nr:hypothetical protein HMPREF7215_1327 [Pyramidobacter piscolens W5455]
MQNGRFQPVLPTRRRAVRSGEGTPCLFAFMKMNYMSGSAKSKLSTPLK